MNIALRRPCTADQFLDWAARREEHYQYDGIQPVAMTRGTADHSRITLNIHAALRSRLRGTPCSAFGPDLAVRTRGDRLELPEVGIEVLVAAFYEDVEFSEAESDRA